MLTHRTKAQLVAFAVISIVAIIYALLRFTDVARSFGQDIYKVSMNMNNSGGIFSNAEVTYRGLKVGRVGDMKLEPKGLQIQLEIEPTAPKIPSDLNAVVMDRSAIGEQFVDLRPRNSSGPYLHQGSTISADRVTTPPETAEVIQDAHDFAASVPTDALRTVVDESYNAFHGTGDDLRTLMDNSSEFVDAARKNLPDTVGLLRNGSKVLDAVDDERGNIVTYSKNLKDLSATLKGSDSDIRKLIDQTPPAMKSVSRIIHDAGPGLSALVANLITVGNVLDVNHKNIENELEIQPALSGGAAAITAQNPGKNAPIGLTANVFNPPPCTKGYEGTHKHKGSDTGNYPWNTNAYCAEPKGSPIDVRGAENAPAPK